MASVINREQQLVIDYLGLDINRTPSTDLVADVTSMPLASDTFDVVMCVHVLEHVSDDWAAIQELYRVVKPGGVVGISVPLREEGATIEDFITKILRE